MRRFVLAIFVLALAAPGSASAARFAIGVEKGADSRAVAERIELRTGNQVSRIGPFALSVRAADAAGLSSVTGVAWVERIRASRRLTFTPNDPLAVQQWYLSRIHAFDAWPQVPNLAERARRRPGLWASIPATPTSRTGSLTARASSPAPGRTTRTGTARSSQARSPPLPTMPQGIAGVGFRARLLVAKIVRSDGTISPDAEARAIHWAVDNGARVINMSFGGVRDPRDPNGDTYSPLEAAAVRYAVSQGVLVVAAVGNADNAPTEPWGYAGYPAALPHVLGVSAIARDGTVPNFSNRDVRHNDITAPGEGIFSTLPRALTRRGRCLPQGYSDCGPVEFRRGEGTSFSAPQVAGAAACSSRPLRGRPPTRSRTSSRGRPPMRIRTRDACAARPDATHSPAGACSTSQTPSAR